MSTLAAESHQQVSSSPSPNSSSTGLNSIHRVQDLSTWSKMLSLEMLRADLYDQNALIPYVYCFIKNFICSSGSNTVAIDNKIEQAMDLVKSHLMFAVREEVEVLKEKISDLMDRISLLEYENTILRANATPETLAQLAASPKGPSQGGQNPNGPSNPS